jgi:FAD/FMN-containing dehydrogenase
MQTYANFTVGGSVSVNCHGRYIGHGPIVSSVLEIKLITASGEIITANRTQNTDVFAAAIGGYGGLGVIVEVTLQLADNVKVERQVTRVTADEYNDFFDNNIREDTAVIFQNGDLYPPDFDIINSVAWRL